MKSSKKFSIMNQKKYEKNIILNRIEDAKEVIFWILGMIWPISSKIVLMNEMTNIVINV